MATKISVEIHKSGSENDNIIRLVTSVNEGKATIFSKQLMGYIDTRNAMWPSSTQTHYERYENTMIFSEDEGKTPTLTLTWKEVQPLSPLEQEMIEETKSDDIPKELYQQ